MAIFNEMLKTETLSFQESLRAINTGKAKKKAELQAEQVKLWQDVAKSKVERIKAKALRAAKRGERSIMVKKLKIGVNTLTYSNLPKNRDNLSSGELLGLWKHVYIECLNQHIQPTVSWQHDGVGMYDWYEFYIKW